MMRWFVMLISLPLMSCKTPSKPPAASPSKVYVKTASEAMAAGLTSAELSDLEAFFDFVQSGCRTGQYRLDPRFPREDLRLLIRNSFERSYDPRFILLTNDQHLELGLTFNPGTHRLHVLDPSKLSGYNEVRFVRTSNGYDLTYIDGCVLTPIKIVKNRRRPYIITLNLPD